MSRYEMAPIMSVASYMRTGFMAGALAILIGASPFAAAHAAGPETSAKCDKPLNLGGGGVARITQERARASVEITQAGAAGRTVEIEYGEEYYVAKFGDDGVARVAFALTAPENTFTVSLSETAPITCSLAVPEFDKIFRVIMRWRDPVQLDLNVIEPNGRLNETGSISSKRPNTGRTDGIGQMDIIGAVPANDAVAELSYVADSRSLPQEGVFSFKVDFVTRGSTAEPPYCGDSPLASPRIDFIKIDAGKVTVQRLSLNRIRCHEKIPDNRRLIPIRS